MNRLVHPPKEVAEQSAKPHIVRRAIRYRAADNAREAIRRQFPSIFVAQSATLHDQESANRA